VTDILAPSGNANRCDCDGLNLCAPGLFCTVPTPECPSQCFTGDECPEGSCTAYSSGNWTATYSATSFTVIGDDVLITSSEVSGALNGSATYQAYLSGTFNITLTYTGGGTPPPCVSITITSTVSTTQGRPNSNTATASNGLNGDPGKWVTPLSYSSTVAQLISLPVDGSGSAAVNVSVYLLTSGTSPGMFDAKVSIS
jgi:hypothetical protein